MGDKQTEIRVRSIKRGLDDGAETVKISSSLTPGQAGAAIGVAGGVTVGAAIWLATLPFFGVAALAGAATVGTVKNQQRYVNELDAKTRQFRLRNLETALQKADSKSSTLDRNRIFDIIEKQYPEDLEFIKAQRALGPIPEDAPPAKETASGATSESSSAVTPGRSTEVAGKDVNAGSQTIAGDAGLK